MCTVLQLRKELINDLKTNSRMLAQISSAFRRQYESLEISTFYETKKTVVKKGIFKVINEVVCTILMSIPDSLEPEKKGPCNPTLRFGTCHIDLLPNVILYLIILVYIR